MAMISHRLRRALLTATSYVNRSISSSITPASDFPSVSAAVLKRSVIGRSTEVATRAPARLFSTRQYKLYKEGDEITEDTVLFEGCDYNHWLITMDFSKEETPKSPEEMVAAYEETCAQGLGISVEEAKQRMYACSTTTYQGFQAIMTEQESEKFKDLPGVVFILPDSYIDPQNKEYGGDKYENGVITHRPPPIQSGRARPRPRFDRSGGGSGGPQNFQRNTQYGQQPPMQGGGGSYGPQQGYATPGQGQGTQAPPPFQGGYNQGPRSPPPPYQAGYNQGQGSPVPPYQAGYNQVQGSPVPPYQGTQSSYGQGGSGNYSQGPQGGYNQGGPRNYNPQGAGNFGPASGAGNLGPAPGAGNPGYGQGYSGPGQEQNQTFPQADQRNRDWNNNNPAGQPGSDQFPQGRRY
ncbi:multiple organellar RNA editing factor [Arabidopsis thaliana]|uniref:Isoform 2 of Multiple organellar RNA editing factor 1, mitochondrial n=1 Tax=Arabidopsis thaliana TaxID=3702 RepID=O49429-2|nr:multiple organellar RNA editing factor [Arabidopsis thaliana]AEE84263.1 multiple organellar RNA editing factor [Arabidopsis thaliana]|eukprot:NP_974579.1 multiple organellar RNA editing factor [Arabidopsis thaliana]